VGQLLVLDKFDHAEIFIHTGDMLFEFLCSGTKQRLIDDPPHCG
jgi:hypothetical protein